MYVSPRHSRTTLLTLDGSRASQILQFVNEHLQGSGQAWIILDDEDVTLGREGMMMDLVRYVSFARWEDHCSIWSSIWRNQWNFDVSCRQNFIHTNSELGLTQDDATRAISILLCPDEDWRGLQHAINAFPTQHLRVMDWCGGVEKHRFWFYCEAELDT